MVTGHVVMATKRTDVVVVGRPTLRVGLSVIEVAAMCRLATTREHTSRIVSPDPPFLRFCRAPTQGSGGYYPAVVGDLVDPFGIDVLHGRLSGDLGSHRAETVQFSGMIGQILQRGRRDRHVYTTAATVGDESGAFEEVDGNVVPDLIQASWF